MKLFQLDEQMGGRAQFGSRFRQRTHRILQIRRRIGRRTYTAIVTGLVRSSAPGTAASHEPISQKGFRHRIIQLHNVLLSYQSCIDNRLPDTLAEQPIFQTVGTAIVVKFNIEPGEITYVCFLHIGNDFFFTATFFAGTQHDGRAVRVISTHIQNVIPSQLLKAYPDVCLDVLDQVPDMNMSVGIGQCRCDENLPLCHTLRPG